MMVNYYGILEINRDASSDEIKKSFRNLAKKYHPDRNSENQEWAEKKIKLIIKAYKTLIDSKLRENYDSQLPDLSERNFDHKKPEVENKTTNIFQQVKIILNNLANDNGKKAIEDFENLNKTISNFALNKFLSGRDYLDCAFLLAEEYERSGKYKLALQFYKNIYETEKNNTNSSSHSFFIDETKSRIKKIYCKKLIKSASREEAIEYYQNVLKLHINNNERAYIYKKISECYFDLGEYQCAVTNLNIALNKKPTLKGISRIQTKLNEYFSTRRKANYNLT